MNLAALLTSAGINIGICVLLLSLFSILRKQPGNAGVYFGRWLAEERSQRMEPFSLERLVPSPSWIAKAWECSEDEMLAVAGLDAVVFIRILVFSIRIFSIAGVVCIFGVLPLNYFGQEMQTFDIPFQSLEVFTIANVKQGSKWLWVHCLSLYIISFSACALLYFECKKIIRLRLLHITRSSPNPSHFTILVRAVPESTGEKLNDSVKNFFSEYYASSYLSHQIIFGVGKVYKVMKKVGMAYQKLTYIKGAAVHNKCKSFRYRCGLCGRTSNSIQLSQNETELSHKKIDDVHSNSITSHKECAAAFVFFRTRYAAVVASQVLQTSNPMMWVTDLAPEPHDVYWSNLWIPYRQLWIRKIATLVASTVFMFLFLVPVTFVQGLSQLDQLQQILPFLKGAWRKKFITQIVTGYLPSVVLQLFLYMVPPMMMLFSSVEGSISHSGREKSACCKILYFSVWNVFFVNVFSGSVISQLNVISSPKDIPTQLAKAVPRQATFFITYVLTSGWAGLSSEVMQLFGLFWNLIKRYVLRWKNDPASVPSFPYYTEVPKVLLLGLLGFTCSILAPLICPFLLVYFILGYVVYRNQILNVYCSKYETGGQMWPIVHNTTIFSLVLSQIIALGVFGIKKSPVASAFTIPLVICTLLFNEYCRQRFHPVFKKFPAQVLIEKDWEDEESGKMVEILQQLHSAYCQFPPGTPELGYVVSDGQSSAATENDAKNISKENKIGSFQPTSIRFPFSMLKRALASLALLVTMNDKTSPS
ncbi:DNA-directed RNA polymerase III subunit RPC2 [Apostasia shenzhenica]|uniref:DNA-directed RNA polymerase III subunit RPC2 n=1 Tax=Apostasia shenzhenica TaxID=1088818 RepID=A0A2I0ANH5_9ASPA|nr:DNA-directed RNA polymerase III subunit RPC2 [Apostasia shenzhenica]